MLTVRHVSVSFAVTRALDDVDLDVRPGEIHALVGQNGSGKSTLIKVLSGYHRPDASVPAEVRFLDTDMLAAGHEAAMARKRMHFIHQDLGLIDTLDTSENLMLGVPARGRLFSPVGRKSMDRAAQESLANLRMATFDVRVRVQALQPVQRAIVAIARGLRDWSDGPGLLVLDEPTTTLPLSEVRRLFEVIRQVRANGSSVLYVSHRLEEVLDLADRISVLRDGRRVLTETAGSLSQHDLVGAIVGRAVSSSSVTGEIRARDDGEVRLAVRELAAGNLRNLSFDLRAGEILGITGLIGSGLEVVPDVLFGLRPLDRGSMLLDGEPITGLRPARAIADGIGLVPANRHASGLVMHHSIRENITLVTLKSLRDRFRRLNRRKERKAAAEWAARVELQGGSLERPVGQLSGGNQQKVLIAKWLRLQPRVLVLHEPVQGVDVGAKVAIYDLIASAARAGVGIVIVSTDTVDLAQAAHRVLVLDRGRCGAELAGEHLTSDSLAIAILSTGVNVGV